MSVPKACNSDIAIPTVTFHERIIVVLELVSIYNEIEWLYIVVY
jgi:hypothetical protein